MADVASPRGASITEESPSELRTFLFADVRGYTRFTQERGDEAAVELVAKFARLMRAGVQVRGGQVIEVVGDEALAVFGSARQALRAAIDLQARFAHETEIEPSLPLPVGMGLDAGEAVPMEGGYRGEALNLASRLCNLAGPGEILASEGVVYLGRRVPGVSYSERGLVPLKGFVDPVRVIRVIAHDPEPPMTGDSLLRTSIAPRSEMMLPIGGFLGALPSGVLVGREGEWGLIMTALDEVSKGSGRLLLLAGEPGIGKTRLAQEVTLKARHWGFLVATGRCYEQEQSVPYYPFLEALVTIYDACPPELRDEIPRRWPYLARLLPDQLGTFGPMHTSEAGQLDGEDQQRLFRAVTQLLESIATIAPVALLLDDLHWADDSSLKLLQHLARYSGRTHVLLLGTYRDMEVNRQHPLESALLDLSREGLLQEIEVRRLGPDGTCLLMAEILGENDDFADLVELVHRRTDGNAFFIQEMLRALVESGDVYRKDGRWEARRIQEMEVPKSVRSLIGQRLSRLEEQAQDVLREASVLGQEFAFDDLQALSAMAPPPSAPVPTGTWSEDIIDRALEQAIVAGLVRETSPERYAFNHALTQQALYAELSTRRRKRLHLAAGKALERLPDKARKRRAGELAWHYLEGDDAERALPYALMAGDQAEEVFANGDAERHYRTALELARELHDCGREVEALDKLAGVLTIRARYDQALELLDEAVAIHQSAHNREGEACVTAQIGHVHYVRGTRDDGIARLRTLVDELEADPSFEQPSIGMAGLWVALSRLYVDRGMSEEQLRAAERGAELARAVGDDRLLFSADVSRSAALWYLGQQEEALRVLEDVIPRAEAAGDLHTLARALSNTGEYYAHRGDFEKDRLYHERMLAVSERRGDRGQIVLGSMLLSMNAFLIGDWDQARVYLERAEKIVHGLGATPLSTWPLAARGWMALREGDIESASRYAAEAWTMVEHAGPEWRRLLLRLCAEIDLLSGRAQQALSRLEGALQESGWQEDTGFLETLAWAYMDVGQLDDALEMVTLAISPPRILKSRTDLPSSLAIAGMVFVALERWDEAEQHLQEALTLTAGMTLPFEEGRILLASGHLYRLRERREDARRVLSQALAIFTRLGAKLDAARVEAEMALLAPG